MNEERLTSLSNVVICPCRPFRERIGIVSIFQSVAARQQFAGIAGSGNCGNLRTSDDPSAIAKTAAFAGIAEIPIGLAAPRRTEQQRYISASYGAQLFGRRLPRRVARLEEMARTGGAADVDVGSGSGKGANPSSEPLGATLGRATKIHNWVVWRPLIRIRKPASQSACGNCANGPGPLALTPRTPIPRLPAQCLSGPFRSELSARSADRGRVVPVLDRLSGRSSIAPFAPSFP